MNLGTLIGIIVYFHLTGPIVPYSLADVTHALRTALVVHTIYMAIARWLGEMKQFDVGLWLLLAVGTVASYVDATSILWAYQHYSPAMLFTVFGLTALLPLLFGREPFTVYYGVRQAPRWQHRTAAFTEITRVMAGLWSILFFTAAALSFARPTDPMFTAVYANLVILGIGLSAGYWLPPLYMKLFPPADRPMPRITRLAYTAVNIGSVGRAKHSAAAVKNTMDQKPAISRVISRNAGVRCCHLGACRRP